MVHALRKNVLKMGRTLNEGSISWALTSNPTPHSTSHMTQATRGEALFRFNPSWTIWGACLRWCFFLKPQVTTLWNLCLVACVLEGTAEPDFRCWHQAPTHISLSIYPSFTQIQNSFTRMTWARNVRGAFSVLANLLDTFCPAPERVTQSSSQSFQENALGAELQEPFLGSGSRS